MPLNQHIEGGHGEREPRLEIRPDPMHDFLEVADERQHREDRLHEHPVLPLPPLTQFEIGRIALGSMEAGITQDDHAAEGDPTNLKLCQRGEWRSEEHTSELQSLAYLVCRLLLEKKKKIKE